MISSAGDSTLVAYRPLCERLARQYDGMGGAEYDDLEQEGLIAVWLSLNRGIPPSKDFIRFRMRNWIRKCRRRGFTGYADPSDPLA